jgi:hypothetical protein
LICRAAKRSRELPIAHPAATAGFSMQEREIPREMDCLLEGDGFKLPVLLTDARDLLVLVANLRSCRGVV